MKTMAYQPEKTEQHKIFGYICFIKHFNMEIVYSHMKILNK